MRIKSILKILNAIFPLLYLISTIIIYLFLIGIIAEFPPIGDFISGAFILLIIEFIILYKILITEKIVSTEEIATIDVFPLIRSPRKKLELEALNPFLMQSLNLYERQKRTSCGECNTYKPPRAHHCSICRLCIFKYDHHCSLFGTCIGLHNFKQFILFCLLSFIESIFNLTVTIFLFNNITPLTAKFKILLIFILIYFSSQLVLSSMIIKFYVPLIRNNETYVEYKAINAYLNVDYSHTTVFQEGQIREFNRSTDRQVLNPYNISPATNFALVFGDNILEYLDPFLISPGDGIHWPKNRYNDDNDDIFFDE